MMLGGEAEDRKKKDHEKRDKIQVLGGPVEDTCSMTWRGAAGNKGHGDTDC
jgi:hypothetical protein